MKINSLVKNSTIYLISNIALACIPIILIPYLTRVLTPSEYGYIAIYQTLLTFFCSIIGVNTIPAITRAFYDKSIDISDYTYSVSMILVSSFGVVITIVFIFENWIAKLLLLNDTHIYIIYVSICHSFFLYIYNLRLTIWQLKNKAKSYLIFVSVFVIMSIIISVVLVSYCGLKEQGRIYGMFIPVIVMTVFTLSIILKKSNLSKIKFKSDYCRDAFRYGINLVPHTIALAFLLNIDRIIIKNKLGDESLGIFLLAIQISLSLAMVFDALNKAIMPKIFDNLSSENYINIRRMFKYYFFSSVSFISILLVLSNTILYEIIGVKYQTSLTYVNFLIPIQGLSGIYLFFSNFIMFDKASGFLSKLTIFSGMIGVAITYFFVDYIGLYAPIAALFITISLRTFVVISYTYKKGYIKQVMIN